MKFNQFIESKNENINYIGESAKITSKIERLFDDTNELICEIEGIEPVDGYKFDTIQDAIDQLKDIALTANDEQKTMAERIISELKKAKDAMDDVEDEDDSEDDEEYVYKKIKNDNYIDLDDDRGFDER